MKIKNLVVLCFTITILFSCNKKDYNEYEFVPTGNIVTLRLDKSTRCFSHNIVYNKSEDGKQILSLINNDKHCIEFYDWDTGMLTHSVNYEKEGPNGIVTLGGYFLKGQDSIFVFTNGSDPGAFYLTNKNGEIINKYRVKNLSDKYPFDPLSPMSNINSTVAQLNDSIVLIPSSFSYYGVNNQEVMANLSLLAKANLVTGKFEPIPLYYPVFYNSDDKPVYEFFSFIENEGRYIFSFIYSNDIYYSDDLKTLHKVNVTSRYIGNKAFITNSNEDNWNMKKNINLPRYRSFYYDPKNKSYYRFFQPGEEWDQERDYFNQGLYPKRFSVIIMNRDFKVIGETLLPQDKYVASMSFMTENGLYISSSNINDPSCDEDYLKFELFTIKKLK